MRASAAVIFCLLALCACGCQGRGNAGLGDAGAPRVERYNYDHQAFGRTFRISLFSASVSIADAAASAAVERLNEIDALTRPDNSDSPLTQIVHGGGGPWLKVSDQLFTLLHQSQILSARSGGAFDITSGPVAELWRESFEAGVMPDEQALHQARARCGWRKLQVDSIDRRARLLLSEMRIELGDLAVGYAADQAIDALKQRGITRAFIDAGSVIVANEAPPGMRGWPVSAPSRRKGRNATVYLTGRAIAFAGDEQEMKAIGADYFSSWIDPRTGIGLRHATATTAIARRGLGAAQAAAAGVAIHPDKRPEFIAAVPGARIHFRSPQPK